MRFKIISATHSCIVHSFTSVRQRFDVLGADYMGIFSLGWTFSPVDRAGSSSQASYKILVKRSLRLHENNFSPVWATRGEIFSPVDRAEISHVIDKKFQPGLKIYKRMRRTHVYNNKSKKQRFPPSHSVSALAEISNVIAFSFQPGQPGWNSPCNQPLRHVR